LTNQQIALDGKNYQNWPARTEKKGKWSAQKRLPPLKGCLLLRKVFVVLIF